LSESGSPWSSGLRPTGIRTLFVSAIGAAAGMAVLAVTAGFIFGYALMGLGVAIGLALGVTNAIGLRKRVAAIAIAGGAKRPAAMSSVRRLAVVTVVIFALVIANRNLGIGAVLGLGMFQFALLISSSRVMLQALRAEGRP
jgi:hypothetical protein